MSLIEPVLDLSPIRGDLTAEDDKWLEAISKIDPRDYRIGIVDGRPSDEWLPCVERGKDGRWWAGRFVGAITVDGRRLVIQPRLGVEVIEAWLDEAFGLIAPPASSRHLESETFLVRLLARLWCRSVAEATRHGLPLLRLPRGHEGLYVRGRLDVRRTIALLGEGRVRIASTTHDRSLDHPVTRAIVCAERALGDRLHSAGEWRTDRVRQVLPLLRAGVGSRPRLPTRSELERVRYTPITLPFKRAASLSYRIASGMGYSTGNETGDAEGLLVDVAELWELFVLNCARVALFPRFRVEHGATGGRDQFLLRSTISEREMGRLKPDIIVYEGEGVAAVIDAKYKRLADTRERPNGVEQGDLYQLVSYAQRFQPSVVAALAYPMGLAGEHERSTAETFGDWRGAGNRFTFRRLPLAVDACRVAIERMLEAQTQNDGRLE